MPPEVAGRKKRSATEPNPVPEGDHRKRRRNRTTQSCLNCHASKRMCDRKRPACQRCTTLGLTGLCVYEVDDPSQRDNQQDEKSLLRCRVAELEGVIREMKNKPHPKWVHKTTTSEVINKWHARARGYSLDSQSSGPSSSSGHSDTTSEANQPTPKLDQAASTSSPVSPPSIRLSIASPAPPPVDSPPEPSSRQHLRPPLIIPPSAGSSSSSSPESDVSPHVSVPGTPLCLSESACFDVASLFNSATLEPSGFEEGLYGQILDQIMRSDDPKSMIYGQDFDMYQTVHDTRQPCDCLDNTAAYNAVLELSVRLRKVAETLGRLDQHQHGSDCSMFNKVAELDLLASAIISNATPPTERTATQSVFYNHYPMAAPPQHHHHTSTSPQPSTISPRSLHSHPVQQWEQVPAQRPSLEDDSFMSWDMTRQGEWTHPSTV